MKKIAIALPLLALAAMSQALVSNPLEAFDNATVQPTGPRSGTSGKNFFNVEGSANGNFASFGVADFDGSMFNFGGTITEVTEFSISLVQSNAGFTNSGPVRFFVSGDTAENIQPGASIIYNPAFGENGIGTQLDPIALLGTGTFTETATGTVDTYTFTGLSSQASALLTSAVLGGTTVRIVIAPDAADTAATWAGFSNSTLAGPTVTLTGQAVPEPASMVALGLGAMAMLRRRRSR